MKSCEKKCFIKNNVNTLKKNCDITMLKEMVIEDAQF